MTGLVLRWRVPPRLITTRWRGPSGIMQALAAQASPSIAGFTAPPAIASVSSGPGLDVVGGEVRLNISELPLAP